MITYSKLDMVHLGFRRQDELASHTGRLNGVYVDIEAPNYPKLSLIGQRRRGPWKGRHRGFVAPLPFDAAVGQRYTGKVGHRKKVPIGIRRAVSTQLARQFTAPNYSGAELRRIRATHGVGRPVVSDVRF